MKQLLETDTKQEQKFIHKVLLFGEKTQILETSMQEREKFQVFWRKINKNRKNHQDSSFY